MNKTIIATGLTVVGLLLGSGPASAAAVSTTGAAEIVAAPPSAAPGIVESDAAIRVFDENVVNVAAGFSLVVMDAQGTLVDRRYEIDVCLASHMIHFDPVTGDGVALAATVTFDAPVVGVIPTNVNIPFIGRPLDLTDSVFGAPGTSYSPGDADRGAELVTFGSADTVSVSGATVSVSLRVKNDASLFNRNEQIDQVRVITECAPDPEIPEVPVTVLLSMSVALVGGATLFLGRSRAVRV